MSNRRLELNKIFAEILGTQDLPTSKQRVYFQPPTKMTLEYPCILYSRNGMDTRIADNELYNYMTGYEVMVIDSNPDSEIPEKVLRLSMCRFNRHYTADNLNHDVFTLFY